MKKIVVILICSMLLACETEITDQFLNNTSRKMVLIGELVVNESPVLNLTKAFSMIEVDTVIGINDADIRLVSEGDSFVFRNTKNGYYELDDYLIKEGQEYTIYASCEGYDDIEVNIKVPEILEVYVDFSVNDDFLMDFSARITDPEQSADSYSFCISGWQRQVWHEWINDTVETIDTVNIYGDYYLLYLDSVPEYTLAWNGAEFQAIDEYFRGNKIYFSDKSFNGTSYNFRLKPELRAFYSDSVPFISVQIERFDSDFFGFIQSNASYYHRDYGNDFIDTDIPLSQPVQVYSNVEGGFGLVRARVIYSESLDLSEWYDDPKFLEIVN